MFHPTPPFPTVYIPGGVDGDLTGVTANHMTYGSRPHESPGGEEQKPFALVRITGYNAVNPFQHPTGHHWPSTAQPSDRFIV